LKARIGFIGGGRYTRPLNETAEKKFRAISSLGEVFVVGFSSDLRPRMFTEHAHFYLLPQLPFPILRYLEMFVLGQLLTLWLVFRHRVQVVVAQSPYEGFVAALAIKIAAWFEYKVGLVVEVHGDFEESLFLYRRIRFRALHRFVMKQAALYSLGQADVLRAISNSTTEQVRRWEPQKTIISFPTWTDIETFFRRGANRRNDFPNAILFVGMVTPLKGIHYLINAFSFIAEEFRQSRLIIIGKEENVGYADDLRQQIKTLGLENRVRFIGHQSQAELAFRMSEAAVLVLPSKSEGLPRVIIEAMATGTPVIGSRVGGIPELIKDGVNGFLIPPGDEQALAEKLRWVLSNPEKARAMGHAGRGFAKQTFSTENYVRGYRQIFQLGLPTLEGREHAPSPL
jgi:glycosyltransferase involved in cell wall biosynthesis